MFQQFYKGHGHQRIGQRTLNTRGRPTVWLVSCLTGRDLNKRIFCCLYILNPKLETIHTVILTYDKCSLEREREVKKMKLLPRLGDKRRKYCQGMNNAHGAFTQSVLRGVIRRGLGHLKNKK